jgi:hypothetical protein
VLIVEEIRLIRPDLFRGDLNNAKRILSHMRAIFGSWSAPYNQIESADQ